MIIEYTNDGGTPQQFDAGRLRASEIQVIERTADGRWSEIKEAMANGDINAMRTVAWAIKKRHEPTLRFADFDPYKGEMRILLDEREVRGYAEAIVEKYGSNPDDLADAFAELRDIAASSEVCEQIIVDVTAPKDQAPAEDQQSPASPSAA